MVFSTTPDVEPLQASKHTDLFRSVHVFFLHVRKNFVVSLRFFKDKHDEGSFLQKFVPKTTRDRMCVP